MALPEFKANLQVGNIQRVSGTGDRAEASLSMSIANTADAVLNDTAVVIGEQQRQKAAAGEVSQDNLRAAGTIVGNAERQGFAESQSYGVQLGIRQSIKEITSNTALSVDQMKATIDASRKALIKENIPEMASSINQTFLVQGVSAIDKVATASAAAQRKALTASLEGATKFLSEEVVLSAAATERSNLETEALQTALDAGEITTDEFMSKTQDIVAGVEEKMAHDLATVRSSLQSQADHGDITQQDVERKMLEVGKAMQIERIRVRVDKFGLSEVNKFKNVLSRTELQNIVANEAGVANIFNNDVDRRESKQRKAQLDALKIGIETAEQAVDSDDLEAIAVAEQTIKELEKANLLIGDDGLGNQIRAVKEDIRMSTVEGISTPGFFDNVNRAVKLGDFATMEDIKQHETDTGIMLTRSERQEARIAIQTRQDTLFHSPSVQNARKKIKRAFPAPAAEGPTAMVNAAMGVKLTPEQKLMRSLQHELEDDLISLIESSDVVNPSQVNDFVTKGLLEANKALGEGSKQLLIENGVTLDSTTDEIRADVIRKNPTVSKEDQKSIFKTIIKAQRKLKSIEQNILITGRER